MANSVSVAGDEGLVRYDRRISADTEEGNNDPVNGAGKLGEFKLKVKDVLGTYTNVLSFYTGSNPAGGKDPSGIYSGMLNIMTQAVGKASIDIVSSLAVVLGLQGSPDVAEVADVDVYLGTTDGGVFTAEYSFEGNTFTRVEGESSFSTDISLGNIAVKSYDIVIKAPKYLSRKKENISIPETSTVDYTASADNLLVGDYSGDDRVWDEDIAVLMDTYGNSDPAAIEAGDLNGDGWVGGPDVGGFIANFNESGPLYAE